MLEEKRLLRLSEVLRLFPVGRSVWYDGMQTGCYPKPVRLSKCTVAWRASDIEALIDNAVSKAEKARR